MDDGIYHGIVLFVIAQWRRRHLGYNNMMCRRRYRRGCRDGHCRRRGGSTTTRCRCCAATIIRWRWRRSEGSVDGHMSPDPFWTPRIMFRMVSRVFCRGRRCRRCRRRLDKRSRVCCGRKVERLAARIVRVLGRRRTRRGAGSGGRSCRGLKVVHGICRASRGRGVCGYVPG
jgi:hypothetical protein